jgi:hypothetical protein
MMDVIGKNVAIPAFWPPRPKTSAFSLPVLSILMAHYKFTVQSLTVQYKKTTSR